MNSICFSRSSLDQLTRVISHHRIDADGPLVCVVPGRQMEQLSELKPFPNVEIVKYELDEENLEFSAEIQGLLKSGVENVYISCDSNVKPLRCLKSECSLDIGPHFTLCRSLNKLGINDILFFNLNQILRRRFDYFLDDFHNARHGERCFIVGNGPSLNRIDMSRLKNEVTFGCNRGYLGFEQWGFHYTYWTVGDRVQVEHHLSEWEANIPEEVIKFIPFEYCSILNLRNICPINFLFDYDNFPQFSNNPGVLYLGNTTVYYLMEIAVIMGFTELFLVGVDNNYLIPNEQIKDNRWTDEKSQNHFHPDYCEQGKRAFCLPRPERAEEAFAYSAKWCKENGIKVVNASPGTKLECFPIVDFEYLF